MRSDRYLQDDPQQDTTKTERQTRVQRHAASQAVRQTEQQRLDAKQRQTEPRKPRRRRGSSRNRRLILLILVLLLLIAAAVLIPYLAARRSLNVSFPEEAPAVAFGGQYAAEDFILDSSGEITAGQEYLDTTSLGEQELVYTASKPVLGGLLMPSRDFTLHYFVIDTTPPVTLWSGNGTVLEAGTEFDIDQVIAYGDNADPAPSVDVQGKVDMDTAGEYPLHVTVTDASGNETAWDLTVEVADALPEYTDDAERTSFADFAAEYGGDGRQVGIDVSSWQGDIDFEAVKNAGCEFVIIRVGYSLEGEFTVDSQFRQNLAGAREAGLKFGLYLYSADDSETDVAAAVDQIAGLLDAELPDVVMPDYPIAFDWEDFGSFQSHGLSFAGLNRLYDAFAEEFSFNGYETMLYSSRNYLGNVWTDTEIRPVWLAHYTDRTDYDGSYMLWQVSSTGRIDGIEGDVDLDVLM